MGVIIYMEGQTMTPTDIINTRIERAIRELVDLDVTIAKASGQVSIGMAAAREMSITLKANAQRAIHSPITED